eukprot:tig00000194_g14799.t1
MSLRVQAASLSAPIVAGPAAGGASDRIAIARDADGAVELAVTVDAAATAATVTCTAAGDGRASGDRPVASASVDRNAIKHAAAANGAARSATIDIAIKVRREILGH